MKQSGVTVAVGDRGGRLARPGHSRRLGAEGHVVAVTDVDGTGLVLAGPGASFVTGQTIEVNAGWVMS